MEDLEIPQTEPVEPEPAKSEAAPAEPVAAEPAPAEAAESLRAAESSPPTVSMEELLAAPETTTEPVASDLQMRAVLEAIVYVAEEPLTLAQLAASLQRPHEEISALLQQLIAEFERPEHGIAIREVAGGYKMTTKPEHHEGVRNFVKSLKPPLKLSLPALETLAVIAYKQPVTTPEIQAIRGVQGTGVLKTLLDRKLIAEAGRKNVIGKPMLYKTTKEFLIQFGLKDLSELPSLKEFEEIRRMALSDEPPAEAEAAGRSPVAGEDPEAPAPPAEPAPEMPATDPAEPESPGLPPEPEPETETPSGDPESPGTPATVETPPEE